MKNPILDLPRYVQIFQSYLGLKMYFVFGLTVIAGVFEGIGIMMLFPMLESISLGDGQAIAEPAPILILINRILEIFNLEDSIIYVLLFIVIAFLLKGVMMFASLGYGQYLRGSLLGKLKRRLFNELTQVQYSYFASQDTGYFINLVNDQTTKAMNSFYLLCLSGSQLILAAVYILFSLLVSWQFGIMAFLVGGVLFLIFRSINSYVRKLSRNLASENGVLANLLIQTLQAFKYLVATQQTPKLQSKVGSSIERLVKLQISAGIANSITNASKEPLAVVVIVAVILFHLTILEQPIASILVSVVLFYRAVNAVLTSQFQLQRMFTEIGSLELVEREFSFLCKHKQVSGEKSIGDFSSGVSLKNIDFSHSLGNKNIFSDLNIQIPIRSSVAFVGESGAGKTTLADLISLLLPPSSGSLSIDKIPAASINLGSWRSQIGYVSQDTVVFDDTIANNICLWSNQVDSDGDTLANIKYAAKQAHLDHFIETLPDGYDTHVGDRGVRLSGGQRQRLFIARELFRRPNIMILDEATSALDSESEKAIQASIDDLKGKITLVIIAHRLSTIKNVDTIHVLDGGRVAESGSFQNLLETPGSIFSKMVEMQKI